MPTDIGKAGHAAKRKSSATDKRPAKRARSESSDEDGQAQILLLENEIFESKKNYNNIAKLIKILGDDSKDADSSIVAAISLCRVFTRLMMSGDMSRKQSATEKDTIVVKWLRERYAEYKSGLLDLLREEGAGPTMFTLCMRLLKTEGQHLRIGQGSFPAVFVTDMVRVLLKDDGEGNVRKEFSEKFVEEYDDIRFYTLEAIQKILGEANTGVDNKLFDNALEILSSIQSVPESKEELEDFYVTTPEKSNHALYSLTKHKKNAQGAWLALMGLQMDKDQRKSLLRLVSTSIAPWFMKPELLMDFLTDSYDAGGSTSLLALSGVFYLIQERNLDYPSFYRKLYSLLDSEILHSKHRSRFFRLMDTFLSSTHLPAVLVASFLKRLSRLTLNAPPSGVVVVVPWIYNLLKRHPSTTFMIHRETRGASAKERLENEGMDDPFDMEEDDPMETHAIDSSLWEIVTLQSHYHPNVATLAKIISEQFTKTAYNLEDFLDHSYGSMLEAEHVKEVKKTPVIEFEIPKRIFLKQDLATEVEDSLLVKLWDFS
ncbi:nucleolar complex protein-like protein [Mollisia scopiformis]|uniref:Nucleolar complex protein-like protein n=1 Tax=Mollisia scopiformis TaxID=149040 RepID=A0A194WTY6_MOLSC|nr:nucleolar complex protein-like protein [Mollisia scopiformis]KUJ11149.1 nucleolar complex protein-like protein [Mollisia scopiformis]